MRLAIRFFVSGVKQVEERLTVDPDALDTLLPDLAAKHARMMAEQPGMIEIEFLDELNPNARFFRLGTDPSGMADPLPIEIITRH